MEDGGEGVEGIAVTELMMKFQSRVDGMRALCLRPNCSGSVVGFSGCSISEITESLSCSVSEKKQSHHRVLFRSSLGQMVVV